MKPLDLRVWSASVAGQMVVGGKVGGPVHGGGPPSTRQNNVLPDGFNPVNHPIQLREMTEIGPGVNPGARSGLDQAAANGVANQTGRLMDIKLLHEPRSVGFRCLYADPQVRRDIFGGLSFTY